LAGITIHAFVVESGKIKLNFMVFYSILYSVKRKDMFLQKI